MSLCIHSKSMGEQKTTLILKRDIMNVYISRVAVVKTIRHMLIGNCWIDIIKPLTNKVCGVCWVQFVCPSTSLPILGRYGIPTTCIWFGISVSNFTHSPFTWLKALKGLDLVAKNDSIEKVYIFHISDAIFSIKSLHISGTQSYCHIVKHAIYHIFLKFLAATKQL